MTLPILYGLERFRAHLVEPLTSLHSLILLSATSFPMRDLSVANTPEQSTVANEQTPPVGLIGSYLSMNELNFVEHASNASRRVQHERCSPPAAAREPLPSFGFVVYSLRPSGSAPSSASLHRRTVETFRK